MCVECEIELILVAECKAVCVYVCACVRLYESGLSVNPVIHSVCACVGVCVCRFTPSSEYNSLFLYDLAEH